MLALGRYFEITLLKDEVVSSTFLYSVHSMHQVHCDLHNKYVAYYVVMQQLWVQHLHLTGV